MTRQQKAGIVTALSTSFIACNAMAGGGNITNEPAQMDGIGPWKVRAIATVGEERQNGRDVNAKRYGYRLPGILDGMAAWELDRTTVRVLANHELNSDHGYLITLANGTQIQGARVSAIDIHSRTRKVVAMGLAYDTIIDRAGDVVTDPAQIHEGNNDGPFDGPDRLCSAVGVAAGEYGFDANLFFTGEEVGEFGGTPEDGFGGQAFVVDVDGGVMYAVPMLGRAAFESATPLENFGTNKVAILIGDDREAAPLYLYVGEKGAAPADTYSPPQLLIDNGLGYGRLFVWVSNGGDADPEDFNGTGASRDGRFVPIEYFDPAQANTPPYDSIGFISLAEQDARALAVGGFEFSRPEDVSTNPTDGTQVVFASTGRGGRYPSDNWGTTYLVDVDDNSLEDALTGDLHAITEIACDLTILYDGDDAGAGQFPHPDYGLRSPDNLDWADDGYIYLQEDRSTSPSSLFGGTSGMEASAWKLDPTTGQLTRIAIVDRSAVPYAQFDGDPNDLGDWESSGVLDVTNLFPTAHGETLLIANTQAHSLQSEEGEGLAKEAEQSQDLVQGGQLFFLSNKRR